MKILSAHAYYSDYGGEDVCFEEEAKLLRNNGHEVITYFIRNTTAFDMNKWDLAWKTFWNRDSYRNIRSLIRSKRPDVMHVTNTFPLMSLSVYDAAYDEKVPVVQSFHNYRFICPNAQFLRNNRPCEDCMGKFFPWPGIVHACYRESISYTAAIAANLAFHRARNTWSRKASGFIALTQFAREKLIEGGLPSDKVHIKQNFISPDPGIDTGGGSYAVFVGRISREKGIETLIEAWKQLTPPRRLLIIGEGPIQELVQRASAEHPDIIQYLGPKPRNELLNLVGKADFLIVPSVWYEVLPLVIIESFSRGTPVLISDIGSISELVTPGYNGQKFRPGDPADLAAKASEMFELVNGSSTCREGARATFEEKYTAAANYKRIMEIYETVLNNR